MRFVSISRRRSYVAVAFVLLVTILAIVIAPSFQSPSCITISYSDLLARASSGQIVSATVVQSTGTITGELFNGTSYCSNGPTPFNQANMAALQRAGVTVAFTNAPTGISGPLLYVIFIALLISLIVILLWSISRIRRRTRRARPVPTT